VSREEQLLNVFAGMKEISEMFPFTMKYEKEKINDSGTIRKAVGCLEKAKASEIQAVDSLKEALLIWK